MHSSIAKVFGDILQEPSLWHINRRSCSGAVAVGLFVAFVPIPFQMLLAALLAIIFRVNILISIPLVWVSNPITIPPIFYFCYRVGIWTLNLETGDFSFEPTMEWLMTSLIHIWQPFLLGCFIVSCVTALTGYLFVQLFWRYHLWQHLKIRKTRK